MSSKPTIVLVPGAWHPASTWDKVTSPIEKQGYKCISISLPTTASNPSATLADDIEVVRAAIIGETTQGRDVAVVVHSYGGFVGSSAIKGLTKPKQATPSSANGHVLGLILIASGFVLSGVSFLGGFGGKPPTIWNLDRESGFVVIATDPGQLFYHDLPQEEREYWVSKLGQQSIKSLEEGEHSYAGWMDVPVWYLGTTEDQALPLQAQRMFVQMARDAGGDVTVREVVSSHSPMLSKPKETVEFILEAVRAFVG